jgi:glycosyltransferase involved in cell wall biosynthesis
VIPYGTAGPPNCASEQKAAFLDVVPEAAGKLFLLFLGRIHPKKGIHLLLDGFSHAYRGTQGVQLIVAGSGDPPYVEALKSEAAELGIADRVLWPGMLKGDAKWGAFRSAEAFVLTSHQENFGIAVVEALACGTPVLITKPVNIWREIEADGVGMAEPDTRTGVRTLLSRWKELPTGERLSMAAKTRDCYIRHFNIQASAESIAKLAQKV